MLHRLPSLFRAIFRRRDFENSMADELRFHIEQYTEDLVRSGVAHEEAARRASIEFGTVDAVKDDCRQVRGLRLLDEVSRELRYAARSLRKTPGFTAAAVLPLALCLGATMAIFAVVDAVLLRPLPFPEPGRLVTMYNSYPKAAVDRDGSSIPNYYERRGHIAAFAGLSLFRYGTAIVGEVGSTEREHVLQVSPDFFTTLGRGPAMGRGFAEDETTYQTDKVAILTDAFWRTRLHADPNALGRSVRIDGVSRTIVGVLPPDFRFLSSEALLYVPLASSNEQRAPANRHSNSGTDLVARLKPGATLAEAQSQIDAHDAAIAGSYPQAKMIADAGFHTKLLPLHADHVAAIRPTLLLMQSGVIFLLLIGAVNLVNLLLVRANGRTKELAVRLAIGASRAHVVSEVIVETTLLTLIGGLLSLVVAAVGIRLLGALGTERLPLGTEIAFDGRVALVALAGSIALGLAAGLPIAWFNLRRQLGNALQSGSRGSTGNRAAQRLRHGFVMAQIALAFVLLSGAGLLGVSLKQVMAVSPGFRPDHILTAQISLPSSHYPGADAELAFTEKLVDELRKRPGVLAAGAATNVPLSTNDVKSAIAIKGQPVPPGSSPHAHYAYSVAGDYFSALGFPLREGRFLTPDDSRRPERACVVDEDFARRYWPRGGAVGHRLFLGSEEGPDADAFTVVGVVGTVKQAELTESQNQGAVYFPFRYRSDDHLYVVARTGPAPDSLSAALPDIVRTIDAELPVYDVRSMDVRIADSLMTRRTPALLAGIFAGVALLLAAIGTYGVMSYAVTQRSREIGVRMALGATPGLIRRQFLTLALRMLAAGSLIGLLGAWITGRMMQTLLYHVPAIHLATIGAAAGIMGAVTLIACLVPSHRAARISPMEALSEQ